MDSHQHHHHHHHSATTLESINNAFKIGIGLNLLYVIIQVVIGLNIQSLSILTDAAHNFLDVTGLALAMLAFKLHKSKATQKYTYGYKKSSIIISLFNTIVLIISIVAIGYSAIIRLQHPVPMPGKTISLVALIGIFINGISALLLFKNKGNDINIKGAFLHLFSDAIISFAIVIGGIIIYFTHLYWIDSVLSIIVCIVVIASTWGLLKDSLRLSLDGVPVNIDIEKIKQSALKIDGVIHFNHIHIWAISTSENALTGHLVVSKNLTSIQIIDIKQKVKHTLEHLNIHHSTLEIDNNEIAFLDENC